MRFSSISALGLPLLAAATQQESPLDQFKTQAQFYLSKVSAYIPSPNKPHTVVDAHAAAAKAGGKTLDILTLDGWKDTIYSSVKPQSTTPEQWWVLITGGNKTCFGHCSKVETAFNESAAAFALIPTAPHMAYLNCDSQPVLCNSWAVGPPNVYIFDVAAPPAPVDARIVYLNSTTTTVEDITKLWTSKAYKDTPLYNGYFHPFDGELAKFGLGVPLGYLLWVFAVIPSWMFMIGISMVSRNIMGKKNLAPQPGAGAPRTGGTAPAR